MTLQNFTAGVSSVLRCLRLKGMYVGDSRVEDFADKAVINAEERVSDKLVVETLKEIIGDKTVVGSVASYSTNDAVLTITHDDTGLIPTGTILTRDSTGVYSKAITLPTGMIIPTKTIPFVIAGTPNTIGHLIVSYTGGKLTFTVYQTVSLTNGLLYSFDFKTIQHYAD